MQVTFERVRGFQPPWHTVAIYTCSRGHITRLRVSWRGPTPNGGIRCYGCEEILPFVSPPR